MIAANRKNADVRTAFSAARHTANPENAREVAAILLDYLRHRWDDKQIEYVVFPEIIPHGWETYTYRFQVRACPGLPKQFTRPLILRVYASPAGLPNARREWLVEDYLKPIGYPVVNCLFLEEDLEYFGGPFLVSMRAEGEVFPDYLDHHRWRVFELPHIMGSLHAELHQIPVAPELNSSQPFLDRQLEDLDHLVREYDLAELRPGYRWLARHHADQDTPDSVLHLDFHPLNLLYAGSRGFTVLDWSQVDVGDRHADVAVTKMFLECMQIERSGWWQRFSYWGGRILLRRGYLAAYRRELPLNKTTLGYYSAWASLRRLCTYGAWLKAGPAAHGSKPGSLVNLTQDHVDCFCRYFERHSGVAISMRIDAASCGHSSRLDSLMTSQAILG